ncbi:MAG: hypothetical protein LBK94_04680 [Prevotellaceae bacterium]|nr:hypothetical protein [Prevotellaceae bacterium]
MSGRSTLYHLLICKHDWDISFADSYQMYYARQTKTGFNTSKPLLKAIGKTLNLALNNMNDLLSDESEKGNLNGRTYRKRAKYTI